MTNKENFEFLTIEYYYSQLGMVGKKKNIELPIVKSSLIVKINRNERDLNKVGELNLINRNSGKNHTVVFYELNGLLYRKYGKTISDASFYNIKSNNEILRDKKFDKFEQINYINEYYAKSGINYNSGFMFSANKKNLTIIDENQFLRVKPNMFSEEKVSNLYLKPLIKNTNYKLLITKEKAIKDIENVFKNSFLDKNNDIFIETTPFAFCDAIGEKSKYSYNDPIIILNPNNLLDIGEINRRKNYLEIHKITPLSKPSKFIRDKDFSERSYVKVNSLSKNKENSDNSIIISYDNNFKELFEPKEWLDTYYNVCSYLNLFKNRVKNEYMFLNALTVQNKVEEINNLINEFTEDLDDDLLNKIDFFIENTKEEAKSPNFWHPSLKWTSMYEDQDEFNNFLKINSESTISEYLIHDIDRLNTNFSSEGEANIFQPDVGINSIRRQKKLVYSLLDIISNQIKKSKLEYKDLLKMPKKENVETNIDLESYDDIDTYKF
jgi:hypothetical protein